MHLHDHEESIIYDNDDEFVVPFEEVPSDVLLQQAIARKRDLKGSYKAKLSLEKLIIEHERKKIVLQLLRAKYDIILICKFIKDTVTTKV